MADKSPLAEYFIEALPEAAARILEGHPPAEVSRFVDRIPDPLSGKALASMLPYHAARCFEGLTDEAAVRYLVPLRAQRVAAILRHMPPDRRRPLLDALPRGLSTRVGLLLNYSVRSVGAWMDPSPPAVPSTALAAPAMAQLQHHEGRRHPDVFSVDAEERPVGTLVIADLAWAEPDRTVADLAKPVPHTLAAGSTLATANRHVGWIDADRLPVIDRAGRLVGVLRHAALRLGLEREMQSGAGQPAMGDPLDLTNLWYQGLAGTLNAALAPEAQEPSRSGKIE